MTLVVEWLDPELRVVAAGEPLYESRACALVGRDVEFGNAALANARLRPRDLIDAYLDELTLDRIDSGHDHVQHHADLAYQHLRHAFAAIAEPAPVVFALPGHYSQDQLALLLGIASECGVAWRGLVDASVAAAASAGRSGDLLHLDVYLHRTQLTRLRVDPGAQGVVRRVDSETSARLGLVTLHDRYMNVVADAFVQQTRFDPMHAAATEQQLFDALPGWLSRAAGTAELSVELESAGAMHRATVPTEDLTAITEASFAPVLDRLKSRERQPDVILLSHRAAAVPGLAGLLAGVSAAELVALPASAVSSGIESAAATFEDVTPGADVEFTQALPLSGDAAPALHATPPAEVPEPQPATEPAPPERTVDPDATQELAAPVVVASHVLIGHTAWPLQHGLQLSETGQGHKFPGGSGVPLGEPSLRFTLTDGGFAVENLAATPLLLNEQVVREPVRVRAGDTLFRGDRVIARMIRTESVKRRRPLAVFSLSFLDIMSCGFGAVILFFMIINKEVESRSEVINEQLMSEVALLEEEVQDGERNLVQLRNSLLEVTERVVDTRGRADEVRRDIETIELRVSELDATTLASIEDIRKLKADIESLEKDRERLKGAMLDVQEAGRATRSFEGEGQRQYLTGIRMSGDHILILVDGSASMLDNTLVNVIRRRNLPDHQKQQAEKWQRAVRTVDWITTQVPLEARFQIYVYRNDVTPLLEGTLGEWQEVLGGSNLQAAVERLREDVVPFGGTSLRAAFEAASDLDPLPDTIFLLADGLPTVDTGFPDPRLVNNRRRQRFFQRAVDELPRNVPVNVMMFPMEGDPLAASAYWQLAQITRGSFLSPAEDWP